MGKESFKSFLFKLKAFYLKRKKAVIAVFAAVLVAAIGLGIFLPLFLRRDAGGYVLYVESALPFEVSVSGTKTFSNGDKVASGKSVKVTVGADDIYNKFSGWHESGEVKTGADSRSYTFRMLKRGMNLKAECLSILHEIKVEITGPGKVEYYNSKGSVISGQTAFKEGDRIDLRAFPNVSGSANKFDGWYDTAGKRLETSLRYTVSVPAGGITLGARFYESLNGADYPVDPEQANNIEGTGGEGDPYILADAEQLTYFADRIISYGKFAPGALPSLEYFRLSGDINLREAGWKPIMNFSGYFDGAGYMVSRFNIDAAGADGSEDGFLYAGLFGKVDGGRIFGLSVSDFKIDIAAGGRTVYAGGIAGRMLRSAIGALSASGSIKVTGANAVYAGAIAGYAENMMGGAEQTDAKKIIGLNSSGSVTVKALNLAYAGGLFGFVLDTVLSQCQSRAIVVSEATGNGAAAYAGGLLGHLDGLSEWESSAYNGAKAPEASAPAGSAGAGPIAGNRG